MVSTGLPPEYTVSYTSCFFVQIDIVLYSERAPEDENIHRLLQIGAQGMTLTLDRRNAQDRPDAPLPIASIPIVSPFEN